jgi:hypothetical protein
VIIMAEPTTPTQLLTIQKTRQHTSEPTRVTRF